MEYQSAIYKANLGTISARWGMEFEKFCVNLAKARLAKGMSAYELSLRLGKDASYISKVENGKINISLKSIFDLCKILSIAPKTLFEFEENK